MSFCTEWCRLYFCFYGEKFACRLAYMISITILIWQQCLRGGKHKLDSDLEVRHVLPGDWVRSEAQPRAAFRLLRTRLPRHSQPHLLLLWTRGTRLEHVEKPIVDNKIMFLYFYDSSSQQLLLCKTFYR